MNVYHFTDTARLPWITHTRGKSDLPMPAMPGRRTGGRSPIEFFEYSTEGSYR